jgi:peptide deformylase
MKSGNSGCSTGCVRRRDPHPTSEAEAERREPGRGRAAHTPSEIPRAGWRDILLRVWRRLGQDNVSLIAAGVALNTLLAVFPAMAVLASVYGMFASPAKVARDIAPFYGILPHDAASIIQTQLQALARPRDRTLGIAATVSLVVSIYYSSQGVSALMSATNIAYAERERRSYFKVILVALCFALGGVVGFVLMLLLTVAVPLGLEHLPMPGFVSLLVLALRWVLLWAFAVLGLAVVYRYAPSRENAQWRWVSWGSVIAATLWLLSSFLFSLYVRDFGSYSRTYACRSCSARSSTPRRSIRPRTTPRAVRLLPWASAAPTWPILWVRGQSDTFAVMAVRPVLKMGEPLLRQAAAPVQRFDAELTALVADMTETMRALNGAGLAAPQIGVSLRTSNPRYPDVAPIPFTVLVNPELAPIGDEQEEGWEGCLSVPGLRGLVPRYKRLRYRGYDIEGTAIDRTVEGFHARVVQHEVDHLDGVLYPQRMRDLRNFGFEDALRGQVRPMPD